MINTKPPILFAWTAPVQGTLSRVVDHTWVTSNIQVSNDPPPKQYWYCAGVWRATVLPAKMLGQQRGDIRLARCIDTPNVPRKVYLGMPSADIAYGIDGVCHQIANRILWATKNSNTAPLTVQRASGYAASHRLYHAYGRHKNDWDALLRERCGVPSGATMEDDDHITFIRKRLDNPDTDDKLAEIRTLIDTLATEDKTLDADLHADRIAPAAYVGRVNQINDKYMRGLAEILTADEYRTVMGYEPNVTYNLIDPELFQLT